MAQNNNDADNVVSISNAPVQSTSQEPSTDEQVKAVKAKGDKAQQNAIQAENKKEGNVPITEQSQTLNTGVKSPQQSAPPATNSDNINVEDFINQTTSEMDDVEATRKAKQEKKALLTRATRSIDNYAPIRKINVITNELIGEYIEYLPDNTGKTVYDYMEDPTVKQHLEFKLPEGANVGDKLTTPISVFWVDPNF